MIMKIKILDSPPITSRLGETLIFPKLRKTGRADIYSRFDPLWGTGFLAEGNSIKEAADNDR